MRARRTSSLALVTIATAITSLTASSAVADGVDIGSTAALPGQLHACSPGTTFFQDTVAAAPGYTATSYGVVTSFSLMAYVFNPGSVSLRTAHEGPDNTYTITGASETVALAPGRLNSFPTRIPINAGDVIAIHVPKEVVGSFGCDYPGAAGDEVRWRSGGPFDDPVGTTIATDTGDSTPFRLNLAAHIEPDADADGYGDLTQDGCPAVQSRQDDCIPPDTVLKRGPKKKIFTAHSKARVKISFSASEPGTFTCKLDRGKAKKCGDTFKARVKPGKHKVKITAIDQAGNADPSPLVVKFRVVRKA